MKFLLTPAGLRNQALTDALQRLLQKPFSETKIIYISTAANPEVDDKRWMIDNLNEFNALNFARINIIDIAGLPLDLWQKHLNDADVLAFGGGDEIYLADILKKVNMKAFLASQPKEKVYLGISAGSMVTARFLPDGLNKELFQEDYGSEHGEGMEFQDFIFVPHLNSTWFTNVTKGTMDGIKYKLPAVTYCLDDEMGLVVDGDTVEIVGSGDTWIYKP